MKRVLVTGSRDWTDWRAIYDALEEESKNGRITVIHGGCPTGADKIALDWVLAVGDSVEVYNAEWATHGRAAGPLRNKRMVDSGADVCLAFPLGTSRGTRGCLRLAQEAGIPTRIFEGEVTS